LSLSLTDLLQLHMIMGIGKKKEDRR
jgi:hypothetical protein